MYTIHELQELYDKPLFSLLSQAHLVHREHHIIGEIQVCQLISVKTGGCIEDCKYCAQSSRYQTAVRAEPMMSRSAVLTMAKKAAAEGSSRICLGAAWREVKEGKQFDEVLAMIQEIRALGLEVCCTLGMLKEHQAKKLKEAGLYAYNHNLDTSEKFYPSIITTRSYQERLDTLHTSRKEGLSLCCGAILGLGESASDRLELLHTLCSMDPAPESIPINTLTAIPGTPLEDSPPLCFWDHLRFIALARITCPQSIIRLSAGRQEMSSEQQTLAFLAGANSIHSGEKLLTVANAPLDQDAKMFTLLGLTKKPPYGCTQKEIRHEKIKPEFSIPQP